MSFFRILFTPNYVLLRIIGHKDRPVAQPILLFFLSTVLAFQSNLPFKDLLSFLVTSYHVKQGHLSGLFPSGFFSVILRIKVDSDLIKRDELVIIFHSKLNLTCSVFGKISLARYFFILEISSLLLVLKFSVEFYF